MNIQEEKALIAERLDKINDLDLLLAIKNLMDFGLKMESAHYKIPDHHKTILDQRLDVLDKNPNSGRMSKEDFQKKIVGK